MKKNVINLLAACLVLSAAVACSDSKDGDGPGRTYKVGDFYNSQGVKGIVYKLSDDTGMHGLIVSLDETTAAWATGSAAETQVGAVDDYDGMKNQTAIEKITGWQTKYPAFAWCAAKNTDGAKGWFLPAYYQLRDLYDVWVADKEAFNRFLTNHGGTAIVATSAEDQDYWSSTEDGQSNIFAFSYEFYQGNSDVPFKSELAKVRAVHAF